MGLLSTIAPLFLMVSSRLDDIYALLQDMMSYLQDSQFAMLYEMRDDLNAISGGNTIGTGSSDLVTIGLLMIVFLGMIFGGLLMKVFWDRLGR